MRRFLIPAVAVLIPVLAWAAGPVVIFNGAPQVSASGTACPTTNPNPEGNDFFASNCTNPPCSGQSKTLPGAIHLTGCSSYYLKTCVQGINNTLSDGGIIPNSLSGSGSFLGCSWSDEDNSGQWSRSPGADESVPSGANGYACWTFLGHSAVGADWLYLVPNSVAEDAGTTVSVNITASCIR